MRITATDPIYEVGGVSSTGTFVGVGRGRSVEQNSAQLERARLRRIRELQAENYRDQVKIEIPAAFLKGGFKTGKTVNSRRVLASKKTIANLWDDDPSATERYMSLAASPSVYPARPLCAICGDRASAICMRCGEKHCGLACDRVHSQRCNR